MFTTSLLYRHTGDPEVAGKNRLIGSVIAADPGSHVLSSVMATHNQGVFLAPHDYFKALAKSLFYPDPAKTPHQTYSGRKQSPKAFYHRRSHSQEDHLLGSCQ
jgi:hypothetical protein